MKPSGEWRGLLAEAEVGPHVELSEGRGGEPTLKAQGVYLHSRYRPVEEAARLVDSASIDLERPVLVVGLGLGYHVLELVKRGARVAVLEPDPGVAKLALKGPLADADIMLGVGDLDDEASDEIFQAFAKERPQFFVHPPTGRLHPEFAKAAEGMLGKAVASGMRLGVAVVGPLYGGSLPIAGYLERAFKKLGHRTLLVDNSQAWPLLQEMEGSIKSRKPRDQIASLLVHVLGEWSYARVAEFAPEICIVMAQAPVGNAFPARLAKAGIISAFWFVENWRHMGYWRDIAPHYDMFFHIQPGEFEEQLAAAGCAHHAFVQTGCDPEIHAPVTLTPEEEAEFGCDISFAGAGYYNRNQLFAGLTDYDMKLWGVQWHARELQPFVCRPDERFTSERFAKIVAASKINLNLHSSATHSGVDPRCDAINPRVFEIAACGGFQLCDPCRGLDALFDFERELPVYRDLPELRKHIDYYLAHPDERREIAQRAGERALRDHTYEQRARQMLDALLEAHSGRLLAKDIRVERTIGEMAERLGPDSELAKFLATLPQDVPFTHETINEYVPIMGAELNHSQAIFAYLRELRSSAEALMAAFD